MQHVVKQNPKYRYNQTNSKSKWQDCHDLEMCRQLFINYYTFVMECISLSTIFANCSYVDNH